MSRSDDRARTPERPGPRRVDDGGEDALGAALRALPSEAAGPGFTGRVVARLDERDRAPGSPVLRPAAAWVMLAAAAGVAGTVGVSVMRPDGPPADEPAQIAERPAADPTGEETPAAVGDRLPAGSERPASAEAAAPSPRPPAGSSSSAGEPPDPRASLARLRAELDALRRDHRRLEIGLADLPEVGRDGQPVIYVGGDEGLELVLDLGRDPVHAGAARGERPAGTSL